MWKTEKRYVFDAEQRAEVGAEEKTKENDGSEAGGQNGETAALKAKKPKREKGVEDRGEQKPNHGGTKTLRKGLKK